MTDFLSTELRRVAEWIAGRSTDEDRAAVERWIAARPERRVFIAALDRARALFQHDADEARRGAAIADQVTQRIQRRDRRTPSGAAETLPTQPVIAHIAHTSAPTSWFARTGITAGVAAVFIAGVATIIGITRHAGTGQTPIAGRTYATGEGQRATVTLTDGSRVTLAPRTTLVVASTFGQNERRVAVRGEAYFTVTPVPDRPFIVTSGHVDARVLGTSFDIRRYDGEPETRVAVMDGRVAVQAHAGTSVSLRAPVVLAAGMVARATDSTISTTSGVDITQYQSWTTGNLDFREVPVSEVLATVGRWYGREFRVTDSMLVHRRVTMVLDYSNFDDLLRTIETVLDVTATVDSGAKRSTVTLHPRQRTAWPNAKRREVPTRFLSHTLEVGR